MKATQDAMGKPHKVSESPLANPTRLWYEQYQALVRAVPGFGTDSTKAWYYVKKNT